MDPRTFFKMHLSVFIAGFTGLFGRLVALNAFWIVFFRIVLGGGCFLLYIVKTKRLRRFALGVTLASMGTGALLALHLSLFYVSIKFSNISIGVLTISSISFFIAILEPFINRRRFLLSDVAFSLIGMAGLLFIFHFDTRYRLGIAVGFLCAFFSAMYSIFNKKIVASGRMDNYNMLNLQFGGALAAMCVILPIYRLASGGWDLFFRPVDFFWLFWAGTVCTAGMYLLQLQVLHKVSAFTLMLTYNLEPVYTIILAMLIFNENRELNFSFYVGLTLIVLSVGLKSLKLHRTRSLDPGLKKA